MTTWEKIKDTANNVIHANENAKKAEEYKRKAKRNAIIGGGGIAVTLAATVLVSKRHAASIREVYEKSEKDLSMRIDELNRYIDSMPKNGSTNKPENTSANTPTGKPQSLREEVNLFNNFKEVEVIND